MVDLGNLTQERAVELTRLIFKTAFGDDYCFVPPFMFGARSGLVVVGTEGKVSAGYGIASSLPLSVDLLRRVEALNVQNRFGHFWLSEEGDPESVKWSLMFGFKFTHEFDSLDSFMYRISTLVGIDGVPQALYKQVEDFGGSPYWRCAGSDLLAWSLLTCSKLS